LSNDGVEEMASSRVGDEMSGGEGGRGRGEESELRAEDDGRDMEKG
jgi:hypothetical protein